MLCGFLNKRIEVVINNIITQARDQKFFRAGEFSWN